MADNTYVFIDGEYLRQRHSHAMHGFFGVDGELELSPIMREAHASRAYFYDAIDYARRDAETDQEWEARVLSLERFFTYVRSLSGFHVRPGSVRQGKRRQQKEVDVLLTVDMLTHGFNGTMDKAVLIAGDVDFRPVVEALVGHGVFVDVWYHQSSFAQELPGAADYGHSISFRQLYGWTTKSFQKSHRIPRDYQPAGAPVGEIMKVGSIAGHPVELRSVQGAPSAEHLSLWIEVEPGNTIRVWDADADQIERFATVQYGPITWEANASEIRVTGGGQ
jgi:uncharacterized LabA/DUF88 family protein